MFWKMFLFVTELSTNDIIIDYWLNSNLSFHMQPFVTKYKYRYELYINVLSIFPSVKTRPDLQKYFPNGT